MVKNRPLLCGIHSFYIKNLIFATYISDYFGLFLNFLCRRRKNGSFGKQKKTSDKEILEKS